ncbi:kinesin protein KIN-12B [Trifolium repens]|nr:kinesin protein KIN-12B [Trifolium repens]
MKIELKRVQDELQEYQNSSTSARKEYPSLQLPHSFEPRMAANLTAIPSSTIASAEANANEDSTEETSALKINENRGLQYQLNDTS